MQSAIVELLTRYYNREIAPSLIARWSLLSPVLRKEAVAALLGREDRIPVVLSALQDRRIQATNFSSVQMDFLRTHRDLGIRQQAARFFGVPALKRPMAVQRFAPALRLKGMPQHGREMFLGRCASCHRLGGEGYALGPDLAGLKPLGKDRILLAILEPNAGVRPGYVTGVVETSNGENLIGLVRNENLATITLIQPSGREVVLPRTNLQFLDSKPWSLMPEGLEEGLTPQAMADLLDYIMLTPR